jgi:hypothetical protein
MIRNIKNEIIPMGLIMSLSLIACGDATDNLNNEEGHSFDTEYQITPDGAEQQSDKNVEKQELGILGGKQKNSNPQLYSLSQVDEENLIELSEYKTRKIVLENLTHHIESIESTISFLELSSTIETIYNIIPSEDDEEADQEIDLDLSEVRDFLVGFLENHVLVQETSSLRFDGKEIIYQLSPEYYCVETDIEDDESKEDRNKRLEDENKCKKILINTPIQISIRAQQEQNIEISILVGEENTEAVRLYIFADKVAVYTELQKLRSLLETIISPEDFEFPKSMEGSFYAEVEEEAEEIYTASFSVPDEINIRAEEQDIFYAHIPKMTNPGSITLEGAKQKISGSIHVDDLQVVLPWQSIVDGFYDDEGYSEHVCVFNEESNVEECWEQWVEPESPPKTDKELDISIPGFDGNFNYNVQMDALSFKGVGLGSSSTTVHVDNHKIINFDLNPNNKRNVSFEIKAPNENQLRLQFSSLLDAQLEFNWHHVAEDIEEMPNFLSNERLGVIFDGPQNPTILMKNEHDEIDVSVESGDLTMWSSNMEEDVIIEEGQCLSSLEESEDIEEDLHPLFGTMIGESCSE